MFLSVDSRGLHVVNDSEADNAATALHWRLDLCGLQRCRIVHTNEVTSFGEVGSLMWPK